MNERPESRDERRGRQRVAVGLLITGAVLVVTAYASAWLPGGAPVWGAWLMIAGSALLLASVTALGALNSRVRPRLAIATAMLLFAIIAIGFGAPLLLPAETPAGRLILGLPVRAAIEIYGVGLLPILLLPLLFALEFKREGLDDASLAELRERCAAVRPATSR